MLLNLFILAAIIAVCFASMPLPFYRELEVSKPLLSGNDVIIAQQLLSRNPSVQPSLTADGVYGSASETATKQFQKAIGLKATGIIDSTTAQKLLDLHSADGVKDSGFSAGSLGYLFKLHVPVHTNRSIETVSTLYDKNNKALLSFTTRTHGHRDDGSNAPWPDFGNGDVGLNQFTSSGATVTGIIEVDFNTPEPDPDLYGPWNIIRFVRGLEGNSAFLQPNIRDGILLHTGNWSTDTKEWNETMPMPDSAGCIHGHPSDVQKVASILESLGVVANPNTFSGKNYPYKCQGIAVVELID